MILKVILPELQKKAQETKNPLDDLAVQLALEVVQAWDAGLIKI